MLSNKKNNQKHVLNRKNSLKLAHFLNLETSIQTSRVQLQQKHHAQKQSSILNFPSACCPP